MIHNSISSLESVFSHTKKKGCESDILLLDDGCHEGFLRPLKEKWK